MFSVLIARVRSFIFCSKKKKKRSESTTRWEDRGASWLTGLSVRSNSVSTNRTFNAPQTNNTLFLAPKRRSEAPQIERFCSGRHSWDIYETSRSAFRLYKWRRASFYKPTYEWQKLIYVHFETAQLIQQVGKRLLDQRMRGNQWFLKFICKCLLMWYMHKDN